MNMKYAVLTGFAAFTLTLPAAPTVENVSVAVLENGNVAVSYELKEERAVVTPEFWSRSGSSGPFEEMDPAVMAGALVGDINREVAPGPHVFHWVTRKQGERQIAADTLKVVVKAWTLSDPPAFMTIDMQAVNGVHYYSSTNALPGGFWSRDYRTTQLLLRKIPAAGVVWRMGTPGTAAGKASATRYVKLTKNFYIGVFELTRAQYRNAYNNNNATMSVRGGAEPSAASSAPSTDPDTAPMDSVSWNDFRGGDYPTVLQPADSSFIAGLRAFSGVSTIDLPTSTQWEFACRAGTSSDYYHGKNTPYDIGWTLNHYGPSPDGGKLQPVGGLQPNSWGLYDMVGNVVERCLDKKNNALQSQGGTQENPEENPVGPESYDDDNGRVVRGGNVTYDDSWGYSTSGGIYRGSPKDGYANVGFRLCVTCPE